MWISVVNIISPALASAADKSAVNAPIELSLKRAVEIAVAPEGSAKVQLALEAQRQAEARSDQSRAAPLPDLSGAFTAPNLTPNPAAPRIGVPGPMPGSHS